MYPPLSPNEECRMQNEERPIGCPDFFLHSSFYILPSDVGRAAADRRAAATAIELVGVMWRARLSIVFQQIPDHGVALVVEPLERARPGHLERISGHNRHRDRAVGVADDCIRELIG